MCVLPQRNASIGRLPSSITNPMSPREFLRDIARSVTVRSYRKLEGPFLNMPRGAQALYRAEEASALSELQPVNTEPYCSVRRLSLSAAIW